MKEGAREERGSELAQPPCKLAKKSRGGKTTS